MRPAKMRPVKMRPAKMQTGKMQAGKMQTGKMRAGKTRPRPFTRACRLWQPCPMPEKKTVSQCRKAPGAFPPLPEFIHLSLAEGTRLAVRVRPSARARRTRLTLDPRGRLSLTVPAGTPLVLLEQSLPQFLPWLERAWKKHLASTPEEQLPPHIELPLPGMSFQVCRSGDLAAGRLAAARHQDQSTALLAGSGAQRLLLVQSPGLLRLFGAVDDTALCATVLRQWCRNMANTLLPPYLESLARQGDFILEKISVRDQRSRWGSCARVRRSGGNGRNDQEKKIGHNSLSWPKTAHERQKPSAFPASGKANRWKDTFFRLFSGADAPGLKATAHDTAAPTGTFEHSPAGRISLNWRALLLPLPLLEHLCWHELCHLRHMNHSPAYRAELARYSSNWPKCEKALDLAWRNLPWWALPGGDFSEDVPESR